MKTHISKIAGHSQRSEEKEIYRNKAYLDERKYLEQIHYAPTSRTWKKKKINPKHQKEKKN